MKHDTDIVSVRLAELVPCWQQVGFSKAQAVTKLVGSGLARNMSLGNGNAARRRIERLNDEAEAKAFEQELWESRRLSKADVDAMAKEWEYNAKHEV